VKKKYSVFTAFVILAASAIAVVMSIHTKSVRSAMSPEPENFKNFITPYEFLADDIAVMSQHNGAVWARHLFDYQLMKSTDYGMNWETGYKFEKPIIAIFCDDYDNIFVTTANERGYSEEKGELHKSSDGGNNFSQVLEIEAGIPVSWNFASKNGVMLVSEYGFKGENDNARRIYKSLDYGDTWEIIYEPEAVVEYHNHKIIITDDGTIYQSVGDGVNAKIMKSTDDGSNWITVIEGYHPTSAVEFDEYILWGLDSGPMSGIARLNKKTDEIEYAFKTPEPFNGSCYDMKEADGVVYAMFMSYMGAVHPSSIFYSLDAGETWEILGYIEKNETEGVGVYNLTVDDKYGYIDFGAPVYNDGEVTNYRGTMRFELLK